MFLTVNRRLLAAATEMPSAGGFAEQFTSVGRSWGSVIGNSSDSEVGDAEDETVAIVEPTVIETIISSGMVSPKIWSTRYVK
jgi:hypothetical protein